MAYTLDVSEWTDQHKNLAQAVAYYHYWVTNSEEVACNLAANRTELIIHTDLPELTAPQLLALIEAQIEAALAAAAEQAQENGEEA